MKPRYQYKLYIYIIKYPILQNYDYDAFVMHITNIIHDKTTFIFLEINLPFLDNN